MPASPDQQPSETLAAVERTMKAIEMLADVEGGLSLTEVARRLDVNKSIAVRILQTLETMNYLYRHPYTQNYITTYKLSNFGLRILVTNRLIEQCTPTVRALSEETGELVLLAVVEADGPRWLIVQTGVRGGLQVDPVAPIVYHSTGTGKAWLSTLENDHVLRLVGTEFPAMTPHTVRTPQDLLSQLAEIRRTGVALSYQEHEQGVASVAAPVWLRQPSQEPLCVAIISITAPVSRRTREDFDNFGRLLLPSARRLGDAWPSPGSRDMLS